MQSYLAEIERSLSEKLHQPVHIGHLAGRILPAPELILHDVSIGADGVIQVQLVQVNFAYTTLFGKIKLINRVELDGVQVQGAGLPKVSAWLQQIAADPLYSIQRIAFAHGQLDADRVSFADVDGLLEFDASGKLSDARFAANAHKLALQINAVQADKLQLTLTLHDSAFPLLPNWTFDTFKAVGELSRNELIFTRLEGDIRGGMLTGSATINWRNGLYVLGKLAVKDMPLKNFNKLLEADADGRANFQMRNENLLKLADTAIVSGMFNVHKGLINGVDIVETARLRSQKNLPGGRTHFDEISGHFSYANDNYHFDQVKLKNRMLQATGRLTIAGPALSGIVSADLAMRAGSVALQISGTTENPSLQLAP